MYISYVCFCLFVCLCFWFLFFSFFFAKNKKVDTQGVIGNDYKVLVVNST